MAGKVKQYTWLELKTRAEYCRWNAFQCPAGSWARNYWINVANSLENKAANLPLVCAGR